MDRTLENLHEIAMKELEEINKRGELDENSLAHAYKLIDIIKDIHEVDSHSGYSQTGYRPYYMDGYSYRNRDSMGRYSRDYNNYRGGYSRDSERDDIMAKMGHMMDTAASETERQVIQRLMNQL